MELGAGKIAVVTGAGSGIGFAARPTRWPAPDVRSCSPTCRTMPSSGPTAAIGELGVETLAVRTDVSKVEQVEALAQATIDRFGAVHVVCNNAGVAGGGDPWLGPIDGWEWTMGVNFWGVVYGVRTFLPHIVMSGGGHIVNTASMAGLYPGFAPAYDASKHAVVAVTESLYHNMQMAGLPVGVSCLCPGWVKTGIMDSDRNWPAEFGPRPEVDPIAEISRNYVRRAIDEGTQPGGDRRSRRRRDHGRSVLGAPTPRVRRDRDAAVHEHRRGARIRVPPEETPGMPPRSQMIAEVMAAMAASSEGPSTAE